MRFSMSPSCGAPVRLLSRVTKYLRMRVMLRMLSSQFLIDALLSGREVSRLGLTHTVACVTRDSRSERMSLRSACDGDEVDPMISSDDESASKNFVRKKTPGFCHSDELAALSIASKRDESSMASGILIGSSDLVSFLKIFSVTKVSCSAYQLAKYRDESVVIACLLQ